MTSTDDTARHFEFWARRVAFAGTVLAAMFQLAGHYDVSLAKPADAVFLIWALIVTVWAVSHVVAVRENRAAAFGTAMFLAVPINFAAAERLVPSPTWTPQIRFALQIATFFMALAAFLVLRWIERQPSKNAASPQDNTPSDRLARIGLFALAWVGPALIILATFPPSGTTEKLVSRIGASALALIAMFGFGILGTLILALTGSGREYVVISALLSNIVGGAVLNITGWDRDFRSFVGYSVAFLLHFTLLGSATLWLLARNAVPRFGPKAGVPEVKKSIDV